MAGRRRRRRRRKLLDDLKDRRGYSHLKEEALDRTMWRAGFGRGFGPVVKYKVKVTLVQALRLCTDRTAHRGSRGIALLFYDHCTRRG